MSVNSSSSSFPFNSSSNDFYNFLQKCYDTRAGISTSIAFIITSILLLLPLCIYIIYLGFQQWRRQRSGSKMSHSDIFTFHMVVIELMNISGGIMFCYGVVTRCSVMLMVGMCVAFIYSCGQLLFHTLTCVERYLAAVHPVIYLGLRKEKGIRIRNISIVCVWLLAFANMGVQFTGNFSIVVSYCTLSFICMVVSFCSLSVLYVLVRPGPGAGGEGGQRVDRSKMRAFYTIVAILGVLLLKVLGTAVNFAVFTSDVGNSEKCYLWFLLTWLTLPSSLVLPLLFLHRAGKLLCCQNINKS